MWLERPRYVKVFKSREDGSLWYHQLNAQEAHPFNPDETVFYLEKDVNALMAGIDIVLEDKVKFLEESAEAWKKEFAEKADEKLREKEEFMVEMLQIATKKFVEQELCGELTDANKEAIKFLISESLAQVEDKLKKRGETSAKHFEDDHDADKVIEIATGDECFPGCTVEETKAFIEGERRMAELHLQMLRTKDD